MNRILSGSLFITLAPLSVAAQGPLDAELTGAAWSPYLVGAFIGLLSMLTFYFSNHPLGASGAYAKVAGILGRKAARRHTESLKYYKENPPKADWELMLVVGIILGALYAAWTGGELTGRYLQPMWVERFGESFALRTAAAFLGGVFLAVGARIAGGCTSGHGISGTLQLSVGSWIALSCFFIGGMVTAMILYRL